MPCRLPPARPTRQHSAVREWPIPNHSLPSRRPFTPTPRIKKCSNESASCPAERRAAHQTRHATLRFTVDPSPPFRPSEHGRKGGEGSTVDRKSTRLNSSHGYISYAVFCLKKK